MEEEIDIKNNSDINQALKEFEVKSATEQAQRNISKKEDSDIPGMVKLVIKSSGGAVKDRRQAEWFLLVIVVILLSVSFFIFIRGTNTQQKITPLMLQNMQAEKR